MAKLKTLPKALIVAGVVAGAGVVLYKFLPTSTDSKAPIAAETAQRVTQVQEAPLPPLTVPPLTNAVIAPAPAVPELEAAPVATFEPPPPAANGRLAGAGIASGQKTGTNWPMTEDIIRVCSTNDYPLRNVITNGTLDNINKVYTDPNSQFGIAQEDGLVAQRDIDPKMMSRIMAVFPFFSVEVHAVVRSDSAISKLSDLEGKLVVEGPEGSGTNITVQRIKQLTGIRWKTVPGNLSQADGLKAVQQGTADVEFIVAGQPIQVLRGASGIRLIPISHPKLDSFNFYTKTHIPTGAYPWLGTTVPTYKVNNVLITFAYKNQFQKEIGNLVGCIAKNIDNLQGHGHPKWRDVDPLDIDRVQWPVHPAAKAAIKREIKK